MNLWRHAAVFLALVVNLWVGGDLIEEFVGVGLRVVFELTLIGGWLWLVVGIGGLLRREPDEPPRGER